MDAIHIIIVGLFIVFVFVYLSRIYNYFSTQKENMFLFQWLYLCFITNSGFWGARYFRSHGTIPSF